jgi:hypothetical protein
MLPPWFLFSESTKSLGLICFHLVIGLLAQTFVLTYPYQSPAKIVALPYISWGLGIPFDLDRGQGNGALLSSYPPLPGKFPSPLLLPPTRMAILPLSQCWTVAERRNAAQTWAICPGGGGRGGVEMIFNFMEGIYVQIIFQAWVGKKKKPGWKWLLEWVGPWGILGGYILTCEMIHGIFICQSIVI